MKDSRVSGEKIAVNVARIHDFYAKRAVEKGGIHVDAPVVLCGDEAPAIFAAARLKEGSSQRMGSEWDE